MSFQFSQININSSKTRSQDTHTSRHSCDGDGDGDFLKSFSIRGGPQRVPLMFFNNYNNNVQGGPIKNKQISNYRHFKSGLPARSDVSDSSFFILFL